MDVLSPGLDCKLFKGRSHRLSAPLSFLPSISGHHYLLSQWVSGVPLSGVLNEGPARVLKQLITLPNVRQ